MRHGVVVLARAFSFFLFVGGGCGLAGNVSGESIVATTALVDGFREEP